MIYRQKHHSKNISLTDMSKIVGVTRPTIYTWLSEFDKRHGYDDTSLRSIFEFYVFCLEKRKGSYKIKSIESSTTK